MLKENTLVKSENTRTKESDKAQREWWTNPTWVGLIATLIAAIAPVTTAIYTSTTSNAQLRLEERKQIHEMRQEYLNRVLTDRQSERVLEFLIYVEDDERLKAWAEAELEKTESKIKTQDVLYTETMQLVSRLASLDNSIDASSEDFIRFWELYRGELISVESRQVEALMVQIGRELETLSSQQLKPSSKLDQLSFQLSLTMKRELREDTAHDTAEDS
jgi:hypothetical protein